MNEGKTKKECNVSGTSNKILLSFLVYLCEVESMKLHALVYLLKNLYNIRFTYDFQYYIFGPYSPELNSDINALTGLGVVNKVFVDNTTKYKATSECEQVLKKHGEMAEMKKALEHLNQFSTEKLIALAKMLIAKETHNIQIDYKP